MESQTARDDVETRRVRRSGVRLDIPAIASSCRDDKAVIKDVAIDDAVCSAGRIPRPPNGLGGRILAVGWLMFRRFVAALLVGLFSATTLSVTSLTAGEPAGSQANDTSPRPPATGSGVVASPAASELERLVDRLGHPSYSERERAAAALIGFKQASVPVLLVAAKSTDREIARRANGLLERVRRQKLEDDLARLMSGSNDLANCELPGWRTFRDSVGDDSPARDFYAALCRVEPVLLSWLDLSERERMKNFAELYRRVIEEGSDESNDDELVVATPESSWSVILVGLYCPFGRSSDEFDFVMGIAHEEQVEATVRTGPHREAARRLMGRYLEMLGQKNRRYESLARAMQLDLGPTALKLARDSFARRKKNQEDLLLPAFALWKYAEASDRGLLNELLSATDKGELRVGKKRTTVHVQDLALLSLLRLAARRPEDFGYHLEKARVAPYDGQVEVHVFRSPEERAAALKKWRQGQNP